MFSLSFTLSIRIESPFRELLLFIIVTFLHISDRYRASSRALFPPPMIDTSSFLYKVPSHNEQKLIPFPSSLSSFVFFNFFGSLPIAIIIFLAVYSPLLVTTFL